jgi:hypothetical protein
MQIIRQGGFMNGAHLHLILNHIPVLGAVASVAFILLAIRSGEKPLITLCLQWLVLIGVLSVPVFLSGDSAEEAVEHLPWFLESLLERHENMALLSLICTGALGLIGLLGLLKSRKGPLPKGFWVTALAVSLINMGLMLATANLGGQIRHDEIRQPDKQ